MAQPVAAARIACVPPPGGGPPQPKKAAEDGGPAAPSIQIQAWSPDAPYLDALKAADDEQVEAAYLAARVDNARSPSFFLDCGDHLLGRGLREEGLRVLSNLAELDLGDAAVLRMYAWRLRQASELEAAIELLEDVLEARPDEPQSHRDLALALGERFEARGDPADGLRSAALLWHVVSHHWPRFPEIELIALMELNRLLRLLERDGVEVPAEVEPRFRKLLDLDLRISMSWDTDLTDVDLHVYEPTGEHAYYGSNRTRIGGLVSRDFTQGYGPEEYVLRRAASGKYEIKAHYYSSHQQTLTGACTVVVEVFTDFGRDSEQRQVLTLRLDEPGREVRVGAISR